MIIVSYDQEVNTTYVKFREGRVKRTETFKVEDQDYLMLDINNKGWLLGLEYSGRPTEMFAELERYWRNSLYVEIDKLLSYYR